MEQSNQNDGGSGQNLKKIMHSYFKDTSNSQKKKKKNNFQYKRKLIIANIITQIFYFHLYFHT